MQRASAVYASAALFLLAGICIAGQPRAVQAQPSCLQPVPASPSSLPGQYCGGDPQLDTIDRPGQSLDLNAYCRAVYGASAGAASLSSRADAYAWVCRVAGKSDQGIDMQRACRSTYGDFAIVTLIGLGMDDWRCLRPQDVAAHVVPVLLFPQERMFVANEEFFVQASRERLDRVIGGVRRFYRERTSALDRGTNVFILLTKTSARDWQNLALCTDQTACAYVGHPFPFDRFGYANRIKQEVADGRWNVLMDNSSVIIGGFVSLGASPSQTPTWCGAADFVGQKLFVSAPSNSYAACTASANNPPEYENAFYGTGHEFGHAMGLRHTNTKDMRCHDPQSYVFHDVDPNSNLLRPSNLVQSIMCLGKGTSSELFPFEASRVLDFLLGWH